MKLFRSSLLMLGQGAAFGWFMLRDISFLAILPLIPMGLLFCRWFQKDVCNILWLNGLCAAFTLVIASMVAAEGLYGGKGVFMLILLALAVGFVGIHASVYEVERVSGWWMVLFLLIFIAMLLGACGGIRMRSELPPVGSWKDILIFYLLAFAEPLSLGKSYRSAPFALGILLSLFGAVSYFALGRGAFILAEYPYLSVWSGVSLSAFHHTEGLILSLFYGIGVLRTVHFLGHFKDGFLIQKAVF